MVAEQRPPVGQGDVALRADRADGPTAIANGHLVEQRPAEAGTTWVWEQLDPMATYLVQVLTGDYEVLDGGLAGAGH